MFITRLYSNWTYWLWSKLYTPDYKAFPNLWQSLQYLAWSKILYLNRKHTLSISCFEVCLWCVGEQAKYGRRDMDISNMHIFHKPQERSNTYSPSHITISLPYQTHIAALNLIMMNCAWGWRLDGLNVNPAACGGMMSATLLQALTPILAKPFQCMASWKKKLATSN